jgi:hypothetical protein
VEIPPAEEGDPQTLEGAEPPEGEPGPVFEFTAEGQEHPIEGTEQGQDGVFFPNQTLPYLKNMLSMAYHHEHGWEAKQQETRQQMVSVLQREQAATARANSLQAKLVELVNAPEETMYEAVRELRAQWPEIQRQSETEALKAQTVQAQQKLAAVQTQQMVQQLVPRMAAGLANYVIAYGAEDPRFAGLDEADQRMVYDDLWANRQTNRVFQAENGEVYVNFPVVEKAMEYVARVRSQQSQQAQAAAAAARQNKATVEGGPQPPPTVGQVGQGAVTGPVGGQPDFNKLPIEDQTDAVDDWFENEKFE